MIDKEAILANVLQVEEKLSRWESVPFGLVAKMATGCRAAVAECELIEKQFRVLGGIMKTATTVSDAMEKRILELEAEITELKRTKGNSNGVKWPATGHRGDHKRTCGPINEPPTTG